MSFKDTIINLMVPGFVKKSLLSIPQNWSAYYSHARATDTLAGVSITQYNAETINAFYTCLRVRAETMASIKTYVMEVSGDTKTRKRTHPVDYLLSLKSSEEMNAWNFWYTMSLLEDIWGNAFAYIKKDSSAIARELQIWEPWEVEIRKDTEDESIWYVYKGKAYPSRNVIHFKQNSLDGIVGRSIISINRETLGLAKKQENYASQVYGERPPAVFEDGQSLTQTQAKEIAEGFKNHVKAGLTPMVWGGLKYKPIMMPPGDAQLFESKSITRQEIYSMFRMPASKAGLYGRSEGGTFNNVEQQNINFVQDVVIPSITQKEIECNVKLFSRANYGKYMVEFDISELIRADMKAQKEFFESMLTRGVYNRNEVRSKVGMNPIDEKVDPHGNRHFIQAGFVPADRIDDFLDRASTTNGLNGKRNGATIHQN